MPLYEYRCTDCGESTEVLQRVGDPPLQTCPHCSGKVTKVFTAAALQFKGSGFYLTDYARKSEAKPGEKPAEAGQSKEESSKKVKESSKKAEESGDTGTKPKTESKASNPETPET